MTKVINAQNLFKRYPGFAPVLRGANLQVEKGEMVAIMGPSGCGKSTMLHILGLLHMPDSGTLDMLGINALTLKPEDIAAFRRANLGFVMQSSNLFEHSTVFENVEFPLIYANVSPQERWERVIHALDLVRLSQRVHYPGNRLSGGEQQRVAIARAMVNNPRILLADEPTGALDARTSVLIMENFKTLCHSGGVSLVMVTHDAKMADFCDTIYSLEEGLLVSKKREIHAFAQNTDAKLLQSSPALASSALICQCFPVSANPDILELARRLYKASILAKIYSLSKNKWLESNEGYALPLPLRKIGLLRKFLGLRLFFNRARNSDSIWKIWQNLHDKKLGLWTKIKAFTLGAIIARFGLDDNIKFFYAADANIGASSAWIASKLLRIPFAFQINPRDLTKYNNVWKLKAYDAAFTVCSSYSVLKAIKQFLPDLPDNKLMLMYPPPVSMPEQEETDTLAEDRKFMEILTMGEDVSKTGCIAAIKACGILKQRNILFRLSIQGNKSWQLKRQIAKAKIEPDTVFIGKPAPDNIGEPYKTAQIFIAFAPEYSCGEYELPLYVREAMVYGVSIAATGITDGMAEALKPQINCLMAPADDIEALANILQKLCENAKERTNLTNAAKKDIRELINTKKTTQELADRIINAVKK